jgi:hypothetical protein
MKKHELGVIRVFPEGRRHAADTEVKPPDLWEPQTKCRELCLVQRTLVKVKVRDCGVAGSGMP